MERRLQEKQIPIGLLSKQVVLQVEEAAQFSGGGIRYKVKESVSEDALVLKDVQVCKRDSRKLVRHSGTSPGCVGLQNLKIGHCKNRHPSPICTRFEHHFHALKPHLHRRSFSDTLPENQRHLIALKRHPLWHMQKLCQLSQLAELRSTFFRNRNAVLCQDVLQLSNPLALSLEFFLSCVKVFHRLMNIPPQTGQQNGGNRSRVTVEMSPGVRLQVQAVE